MFQNPQTRQMIWPKMIRKKSLSDELFLHFSSKVQNLTVFFNYLHDSNPIFRVGVINSENVFGRTAVVHTLFACVCLGLPFFFIVLQDRI